MENSLKYANHMGWTDVNPAEIIKWVSAKTVEIRAMDANELPIIYANSNNQSWHIYSNVANPIFRIRLGKNGWKDSKKRHYILSDTPKKYHDYSF